MAERLPYHLQQFLVEQDYSTYTAIDQASWRYIMRVSQAFMKEHAHPMYLSGLSRSGIPIERIPRISEMNERLKEFGWSAVAITGFIPPEVFLEMLSLQILPIACDMRKLENLDYTPSPDIVHEAAGHAPILTDPAYSSFLKKFGEIARWVIFAKEDTEVYKAVLELSEIKEDPHSTKEEIAQAQAKLDAAYEKVPYVSEAQALTRLGWWTTEYGLFIKNGQFLIYGAGLLSSVGESYNCLSEKVEKIPLDINCIKVNYDITRPQPQLFFTDDFKKLEKTVEEFKNQLSYRLGGEKGLQTAKKAETVTTSKTETGLQFSGVVKSYSKNSKDAVCIIEFSGPSQISLKETQILDHGPEKHGLALSVVLGFSAQKDFKNGEMVNLNLDSGLSVTGKLVEKNEQGFLVLEHFNIKEGEKTLAHNNNHLLIIPFSNQITSVFGGAGDRSSFYKETHTEKLTPRQPKVNITPKIKDLIPLYAQVRKLREQGSTPATTELEKILKTLDEKFPQDWLLRLEILELLKKDKSAAQTVGKIEVQLKKLSSESNTLNQLISRGLALH